MSGGIQWLHWQGGLHSASCGLSGKNLEPWCVYILALS